MMHSVSSTECDLNVRVWGGVLTWKILICLVNLQKGDLFTQDAVYHKECTTKYYTRHRSRLRKKRSEGKAV